jgi:hypothetical protein
MRRWRLAPSQDQGSILLAVTIIFALVLVAAAVASSTIGNMGNVLTRQQITQAVAQANGGISDALFRLDQGIAGISKDGQTPPAYFCVNSADTSDTNCIAHSVPGASGVSYVATPDNAANPTTWTIKSVGTVDNKKAAVQETVSRVQLYPWTLFAVNALSIDGNSSTDFSTYSETGAGVNTNGPVQIGTNGTLKCTGGGFPSNVTADYYSANGSGDQKSCGTPVTTQPSFPAPTIASAGSNPQQCPFNGDIPANTTLGPGTYLCTTPVTFEGNLNVNGQVKLYIILTGSGYNSSTNALDIKTTNQSTAYINDMYDYCKNGGITGCPTTGMPVAENLQIFTNSNGTIGDSNGSGYYYGGTIYAPLATTTADGCKSQYYGSVILSTFTCNGAPNFSFNYDSNLTNYFGTWTTGIYQQIPPGKVNIP